MTHSSHLLLRLLVLRIKKCLSVYYPGLGIGPKPNLLVLLLLCMGITEIEPCNWQQHPINEQPESNRSAMHSICPFSPSPTQSSQNSVNILEPIVISLRYHTKWHTKTCCNTTRTYQKPIRLSMLYYWTYYAKHDSGPRYYSPNWPVKTPF